MLHRETLTLLQVLLFTVSLLQFRSVCRMHYTFERMVMLIVAFMYLSWCVLLWEIHLQVPVDELTLAQTNHLHTEHKADEQDLHTLDCLQYLPRIQYLYSPDIERNGHHGVQDDNVSPEAEEASVRGFLVFAVK